MGHWSLSLSEAKPWSLEGSCKVRWFYKVVLRFVFVTEKQDQSRGYTSCEICSSVSHLCVLWAVGQVSQTSTLAVNLGTQFLRSLCWATDTALPSQATISFDFEFMTFLLHLLPSS